ncbi:hypothetical protein HWV62_26684 [Athelia sp. TMB]|nr:hypothetical protein HWV62_26684 [Athelia sp. TMB]
MPCTTQPPMLRDPSLGEPLVSPTIQRLYNDLERANRAVASAVDTQIRLIQELYNYRRAEMSQLDVTHPYASIRAWAAAIPPTTAAQTKERMTLLDAMPDTDSPSPSSRELDITNQTGESVLNPTASHHNPGASELPGPSRDQMQLQTASKEAERLHQDASRETEVPAHNTTQPQQLLRRSHKRKDAPPDKEVRYPILTSIDVR